MSDIEAKAAAEATAETNKEEEQETTSEEEEKKEEQQEEEQQAKKKHNGPEVDEDFDAIVLGTGLTECILSGMLATHGYKVLHLDRNPFYGGECASLNLEQLFQKFNKGTPPEELGRNHLYNVDLIPKVLMCAGELVQILRATVVERYNMEFMLVENSFVVQSKKIQKVPVTPSEALTSDLMGFFEKRRCGKFLAFVAEYNEKTEMAKKGGKNLRELTSNALFKEYGLEQNTITFIGHATALYTNDDYVNKPAYDMVMRCKLYIDSLAMYDQSPYVYPLYGSGELPQAFSRLCAVYGGTYMLQTPVHKVITDGEGVFQSIEYGEGLKARAKLILGDASYFPDRSRKIGQVARYIAIMNHPINTGKTSNKSLQIVIPQNELGRRHDVFVLQLSSENQVCPPGFFIAIVGTTVENPGNPMADLKGGIDLLGPTLHSFISVSDLFDPLDNGAKSKIFVTDSYDAESHFESASSNVLDLFERIYGRPYNFEAAQAASAAGTTVKQ